MSKKDRRNGDRRDYDRRTDQSEDEMPVRTSEGEPQESDSLTALKAILSKVAALLRPLQLTSDEAIGLVERLYGSVLDADMKLAGETDDTRKSSVLAHIQNTVIRREGENLVVEFPAAEVQPAEVETSPATGPASAPASAAAAAAASDGGSPAQSSERGSPGTVSDGASPGA
jgi:hypothetical protein